jgi:succinate dehydrogenase flavin-adding protein (antitoxin of CptAB toxin-antitoxin module)
MRELDALLTNFLKSSYDLLGEDDKLRFAALLELPDPDLHAYLVGRHDTSDAQLEQLLKRIRADVCP